MIFKDDRLTLRNMVKDGNQDVIALLNHYRKLPQNHKELATELRKYLKRKQDHKENLAEKLQTNHSPISSKFRAEPQRNFNPGSSQKKSCPDLWRQCDPQPRSINMKLNDVQLSEI